MGARHLVEQGCKLWRGAIALAVFAAAGASFAAPPDPCRYDAFTPAAFEQELGLVLPILDFATLSTPMSLYGVPSGRSVMLRHDQVVGQVETVRDVRSGNFSLDVYDAGGSPLFTVNESRRICRGGGAGTSGLCRWIEIVSEQQQVQNGEPPFAIMLRPDDPRPLYFRYGAPLRFLDWRLDLEENFAWLQASLRESTLGFRPLTATLSEDLLWAWAGRPEVTPYMGRLVVFETARGPVVQGTVPSNAVFDAIVQSALERGIYDLNPQLRIDTGTAIPPPNGPSLSTCRR